MAKPFMICRGLGKSLFLWKWAHFLMCRGKSGFSLIEILKTPNTATLFYKDGPFPASFSLFSSFLVLQLVATILPMSGFELQISSVWRDCSTNWVTTTTQYSQTCVQKYQIVFLWVSLGYSSMQLHRFYLKPHFSSVVGVSLSLDRRLKDQSDLSGGKLVASSSQDLAKAKARMRKSGGILRKAKSTGENLVNHLTSIDFKNPKVPTV